MPIIDLDTRIVVVQHQRETVKPTSTAGLLRGMFSNSVHVVFGALDGAYTTASLTETGRRYAVLFPRPDATALESMAARSVGERPDTLVVLDGTWAQCSRMSRRAEHVRDLPFVKLPAGTPSQWSVRKSPDPSRLCTFDATLRALAILEGLSPELIAAERLFHEVAARALFMRSRLRRPEVPKEWTPHLATRPIR